MHRHRSSGFRCGNRTGEHRPHFFSLFHNETRGHGHRTFNLSFDFGGAWGTTMDSAKFSLWNDFPYRLTDGSATHKPRMLKISMEERSRNSTALFLLCVDAACVSLICD